jgi:uncharacterized membrane protein YdbT with pleckstrin-like domain
MGYIDKNLMAGETVQHTTKMHWIVYLWPLLVSGFGIDFIILTANIMAKDNDSAAAGVAIGSMFIMIGVLMGLIAFLRIWSSEFGVTNKRVIFKAGLIQRQTTETLLGKVEALNVSQGILARILNYGTISVVGTGGTPGIYKNIKAPIEFRKQVYEQIDARG